MISEPFFLCTRVLLNQREPQTKGKHNFPNDELGKSGLNLRRRVSLSTTLTFGDFFLRDA